MAVLEFNYIKNKRTETVYVSHRETSKLKKGCLLTKLCNTGCASSAQKRKTDFLSNVMTDSASSCCFCHGSSWLQTGRPDFPSITITSRQGRHPALTVVQAVQRGSLQWHGLCCSLSCLWPHSDECQPQKQEEWGATQPLSLLCCYSPLCLHLFYLFVPTSSLCLQHEVQSLIISEVTWYRLAANLEKETLSPTAEKEGFQMEAAQLLSSSILPLKKGRICHAK